MNTHSYLSGQSAVYQLARESLQNGSYFDGVFTGNVLYYISTEAKQKMIDG